MPKNIDYSYKQLPYDKISVEKYSTDLRLVGSLSRLFSDNMIPYLDPRVPENLYCRHFGAINLSRCRITKR